MTPEAMADLGRQIDTIHRELIILLEYDDRRFTAFATAQKQLSLASAALLLGDDKKLALRFALDALRRAQAALQSTSPDEPSIKKIELCAARIAEEIA